MGDLWGALKRRIDHPRDRPHRNLVLVTHGLLMRFFCMHYLGWTEHEFEQARSSPSAARTLVSVAARRCYGGLVWPGLQLRLGCCGRCGTPPTARSGC